ncbi:hypothetical protein PAEPH01_1745 [Pancytospora epiphaga]|nr:hypothetical protein PAEPH01_1745 [Pancytospora epiphaga]
MTPNIRKFCGPVEMTKKEMEKIQRIRRPLYKVVTLDNLDRSTSIHTHYVEGTLSLRELVESGCDEFTIAFYYNELFDIIDYLRYLRNEEVTNVSYNIMKLYLKNCTLEEVHEITAPVSCEIGSKCLAALRGEMYRINRVEFTADSPIDEYTILGIITLHDNIMSNFEVVLESFVPNT